MSSPALREVRPAPETVSGMVVSLLFWLSLLLAAGLFAVVALSPRLSEHLRLVDQYAVNQLKLVSVEVQNEQLQRVVEAIREDKEFAAELTRIEFDAVRADEEIIPVPAELKLETRGIETPRVQPAIVPAWYRPWLSRLAEDPGLRSGLLSLAAVLVVVSFTWLQPSTGRRRTQPVERRQTLWQTIRARYVRSQ